MISATQVRPGMVIKFNNELYSIFKMEHRTPGNLRGFVQVKMRNFRSGTMMEHRFSSEDRVERASLDEQEMEYLYDDGDYFYFMNTTSFEQMHLTKEILGDGTNFLVPQLKVHVEFYEGKAISVELPPSVDLTVVETEPGLKALPYPTSPRQPSSRPGSWCRCLRSSTKAKRSAFPPRSRLTWSERKADPSLRSG